MNADLGTAIYLGEISFAAGIALYAHKQEHANPIVLEPVKCDEVSNDQWTLRRRRALQFGAADDATYVTLPRLPYDMVLRCTHEFWADPSLQWKAP